MRRPGTDFEWESRQSSDTIAVNDRAIKPLLLMVSSFDRGPADLRVVSGQEFYKLYGTNISFAKHGQPAIQAANAINNGASLLIKRLVAEDATLANAVIIAEVSGAEVEKTDANGNPVYVDAETGKETSDANEGKNNRAKIKTCVIKYDVESVKDAKTIKDVMAAVPGLRKSVTADDSGASEIINKMNGLAAYADNPTNDTYTNPDIGQGEVEWPDDEDPVTPTTPDEPAASVAERFPLYVIVDNGVGKSTKRIRFNTDYTLSKTIGFPLHTLAYLGNQELDYEYIRFTLDPDKIYLGKNMSIDMASKEMLQINARSTSYYNEFIELVSKNSGIELKDMDSYDILFGRSVKDYKVPQITIDTEGYDLASEYGIPLSNGSDGTFENVAFGSEEWTKAAIEVFNGDFNDDIFDRDKYPIEFCVDANYPVEVKDSIMGLLSFRKDFMFFRDIGTSATTYEEINALVPAKDDELDKFIANYIQYYDIIDPFTKKQITTTIGYSLTRLITEYQSNGSSKPFAGVSNNMLIPEAIEGTVNFLAKETPKIDTKTLCTDNNLNYAGYINGVLTMELQLTSKLGDQQVSHIHGIINIQNLMRRIRKVCPISRYSFTDTTAGLERYAKDVQEVINTSSPVFKNLRFEWTADELQLANGLFNATILVSNKPYIQAEKFIIATVD